MTNINLTAVLQDRNLTAPERITAATVAVVTTFTNNWVDESGNQMVTNTGAILVFNSYHATVYPPVLTAVLQDRDLTVEIL